LRDRYSISHCVANRSILEVIKHAEINKHESTRVRKTKELHLSNPVVVTAMPRDFQLLSFEDRLSLQFFSYRKATQLLKPV
jgi:hypothetical protein